MNGEMGGRVDWWTSGWVGGRMDDGWMNGCIDLLTVCSEPDAFMNQLLNPCASPMSSYSLMYFQRSSSRDA